MEGKHTKTFVARSRMAHVGILLLSLGITFMATDNWPWMYWPGLAGVYIGIALLAYHASAEDVFQGLPLGTRIAIGIIALCLVYIWSANTVFVKHINRARWIDLAHSRRAVKRGYRCTACRLLFRSARQRQRRQKDFVGDCCPSLHSVGAFPTRSPV
jgi:uncharacterized membrane protein